jgi:hypothetical protein
MAAFMSSNVGGSAVGSTGVVGDVLVDVGLHGGRLACETNKICQRHARDQVVMLAVGELIECSVRPSGHSATVRNERYVGSTIGTVARSAST